MSIRCSNEECESRVKGFDPHFTVDVIVNCHRDLAERLDKKHWDAPCFNCNLCGCDAEESAIAPTNKNLYGEDQTMSDINIEKVLHISTAHMPSSTPNFGDYSKYVTPYGYMVLVSEPDESASIEDSPEWIDSIMRLAHREGCIIAILDADAPIHPQLRDRTHFWDNT